MSRRILCRAMLLLGLSLGSILGVAVFFFAISWTRAVLPLFSEYRSQKHWDSRFIGAFIAAVLFVSGLLAWVLVRLWLRFLRYAGIYGVRKTDVLSSLPDSLVSLAKFELIMLPLFSVAATLNVAFPALIGLTGGLSLVIANANRLPVPPAIAIVPGVFSTGIIGLLIGAVAVKRIFDLSDSDFRALFSRSPQH